MKKIIFFVMIILTSNLFASFKASKIVEAKSIIWGMDFYDKSKAIVSFKNGFFAILDTNNKTLKYIKKLDVYEKGQAGLLDVKASLNFKNDNTIFFTYVKSIDNMGVTTLAKAKLINEKLVNIEDILVTKSATNTTRHFGSRITFDEKHIYFSVGDRGERDNAQDLRNHAGSIIRLNLDGTVPKTNPFFNSKDRLKEIYSYGHRNPQGLFYDKKQKVLFSNEHGPRGGDEINIIKKAQNYGWPRVSLGKEYWAPISVGKTQEKGMIDPIKHYTPSIAPSSLIVYSGKKYKSLNNALISTALKLTHINIIKLDENFKPIDEKRVFSELKQRIRVVAEDSFGNIYFATDSGKIYKIVEVKEKTL